MDAVSYTHLDVYKRQGADNTVTFGWPVRLNRALEVSQGGTGANNAASACGNIGAVKKSGDTMTGNLYIQSMLYPSLYLQPTYNLSLIHI